jgi:curli biogenesis system outer membrane secretion channel CsgG
MRTLFVFVLALLLLAPGAARAQTTQVGILPFDVVSVDNAGTQASTALAKLLRIEMIKARKFTPALLELGENKKMPVEIERAAEIGKTGNVALVIVGTVTNVESSSSSNSASTGGLLSSLGVGGSIQRSTARVGLHVDLVDPATAKVVDSFEVEAKNTDSGLGLDFSSALGSIDTGGSPDSSPMGKALQSVAKKLSDEITKRAPKLIRK